MSTSPALASYKRVIVSKRDGICHACAATTKAGVDFAAVDTVGKWFPFCAACAASYAAQTIGLVKRAEALAQTVDPELVATATLPDDAVVTAVIEGRTNAAQSLTIIAALHALVTHLSTTPRAAVDPRIAAVRAIAADESHKDRGFAQSLVGQYDSKGTLSEKQWACVDRMATPAAGEVENGIYLHTDGSIRQQYTTQNNRPGVRKLHIHPGHDGAKDTGSFEYEQGGVRIVRSAVANGTARKVTQEEAAAFGRLHSFCCMCSLDLKDDRSLVAGYGPTCADNNGFWYPTKTEAAEIMQRPTEVPVRASECSPGQQCQGIDQLCTVHQGEYQARHGRASNE